MFLIFSVGTAFAVPPVGASATAERCNEEQTSLLYLVVVFTPKEIEDGTRRLKAPALAAKRLRRKKERMQFILEQFKPTSAISSL